MSVFDTLRGINGSLLQIGGPLGPQWKSNAGVLEARDFADGAFVIVRGLDPIAGNDLVTVTYLGAGYVPSTRLVTAGAGLTGGGSLAANITINVGANADGSITVNANDIQVGVLATDAQHGVRGGGTQHAVVTALLAGFMSSADFTKLANIATGAMRSVSMWGNGSVAATTTTRFLSAGFDSALASTTEIPVPIATAGVLRNLYVRHNVAVGNGNAIVYTVMVNGVATALTLSLVTGAVGQASDLANTVAVVAGDRVSIRVTKAASVGTAQTDVTASFEYGVV
jgi:hypothetical protein